MRAGIPYRRWLFYLALALPAILLPRESFWSLRGVHFNLGSPLSDCYLIIHLDGNRHAALDFEPGYLFLPLAAVSVWLAGLAWRARLWAIAQRDWLGAIVQAALTSLYCLLLFCFFDGLTGLIFEWRMYPLDWAGLERTAMLASSWLPYAYLLGAVAVLVTLLIDSRVAPWPQRVVYAGFALGFLGIGNWLAPYMIPHVDRFEWTIRFAREQQIEPDAERLKTDARRLDQLEKVFASTPQFGDEFWRMSRRVAHERGSRILLAVMERSHQWTGEEGLIYVPLVALLPRKPVLRMLQRYESSTQEAERVNAHEMLIELDADDTREAVERYSKISTNPAKP